MAELLDTLPSTGSPPTLFVVGLGASAGGIKALSEFFAAAKAGSGAAYCVILHLSPDHDSRLADVLQRVTSMPVAQVTTPVPVQADHIYVVSPNKSLSIVDGMLTVADFTRREQRRAPVDVFFRALADSHGSHSICAILSGTGPNGSAGLKRIKEYGGLVIAQDPRDAEYGDMPRNAIATELVDLVLPAAEMPARILEFCEQVRRDEASPLAALTDPDATRDVLTVLRVRTGHDFANYKPSTLQRRVERRMTVRGVATLPAYARLIRQEPDEAVALMKELLISVTNFFRDPAVWAAVERHVIPRLFLNKGPQDQIRVWVPGCATGEEAYSIAMLLVEQAANAVEAPSIQVFATDLDQQALSAARDGLYSEADIVDIPEERLSRFFQKDATGYRIRRDLRELVLFAPHNVIKDPPFSHLDLISCRNLLIYLNRAIQERVIQTFHFALRPGGYLFVGTSETPEGTNDLFLRVDGSVYESRTVTSPRVTVPLGDPLTLTHAARAPEPRNPERIAPPELHQRLLERYAPPSIIVSEDLNVVHLSETAGRYLQIRGGEPSRDLLALIHPDLRPDLRTALHQAAKDRADVEVRNVAVSVDGGTRYVDVSVRPVLREGDPARGFYLVLLADRMFEAKSAEPPSVTLTSPAEPLTGQLEEELARVKSQLRTTTEQYETHVEEAKASNEELQAMNEELRSAAEELETSKEELQSVNEELTTVNQELKIKIEELGLTNNDFQNFINATDIATIFLDRQLRVKFSTARAHEVFNLLASDIGRPLSDITTRLAYDAIHNDVRLVLDRLTSIEREVQSDEGSWYLMRILPYRTSDNRIDGVVLTFQDVTERQRAEVRVRQSEERLRLLIDGALDYAIFTMTEDGVIDSWNPGAERMFGYTADEIIGANAGVLFTPEDRTAGEDARELNEARRSGRAADERYHMRRNGTRFYCSGITRRLGAAGHGFAKIARDLTGQRLAEDALRNAQVELERRVAERTKQLEASVQEHEAAKLAVTGLLHRLVNAQEDERRRIARDLHDHFGQQLTALRLALERSQSGSPQAGGEIATALSLTEQIGRDLDSLAWELRPTALDELGLAAALPRFLAEWSTHVGIAAEFRLGHFENRQLSREAEVAFYRVAQEALNNVTKHAHASRVDVVLGTNDGTVALVIEDDGIGFDPAEQKAGDRVGLASMRERAILVNASLEIESAPGRGTSVFIRRPAEAAANADERKKVQ